MSSAGRPTRPAGGGNALDVALDEVALRAGLQPPDRDDRDPHARRVSDGAALGRAIRAPELLQIVELAHFGPEHVDDHIAGIDREPSRCAACPARAARARPASFNALSTRSAIAPTCVLERPEATTITSAERRFALQIEGDDIFGFGVVKALQNLDRHRFHERAGIDSGRSSKAGWEARASRNRGLRSVLHPRQTRRDAAPHPWRMSTVRDIFNSALGEFSRFAASSKARSRGPQRAFCATSSRTGRAAGRAGLRRPARRLARECLAPALPAAASAPAHARPAKPSPRKLAPGRSMTAKGTRVAMSRQCCQRWNCARMSAPMIHTKWTPGQRGVSHRIVSNV